VVPSSAPQLPKGSCPTSCDSKSTACSGLSSNQAFSILTDGNRLKLKRTDATGGWSQNVKVTCQLAGARQSFCIAAYATNGELGQRCTTALFYDETPLDLRPALTTYGVEFSFTDTSTSESAFEVVRGDSVYSLNDGEVVTKIPYSLPDCGRQFSSISLTDQQAARNPGMLYVYGLQATNKDTKFVTSMKSTAYRVPWIASIFVSVETQSQVGVGGTLVELCHVVDTLGILGKSKGRECWESGTVPIGQ
jgi:hypothetical protein